MQYRIMSNQLIKFSSHGRVPSLSNHPILHTISNPLHPIMQSIRPNPSISPSVPQSPSPLSKIAIQPSPFQGSMSYTTILPLSLPSSLSPPSSSPPRLEQKVIIQFRSAKHDLSGVTEAHRIHGTLAPLETFRGVDEGLLYVYTAPFVWRGRLIYVVCWLRRTDKWVYRETGIGRE